MLEKCKDYKEISVTSCCELLDYEKDHRSNFRDEGNKTEWVFKGLKNSKYKLQTTLERAISDVGIDTNELHKKHENAEESMKFYNEELTKILQNGLDGQSVWDIESGLIRKFQRQYYHHDMSAPEEDNIMEWLALMQHYGAPTRLLDWTYSFFVAVFFALEQAEGDYCAVWALEKQSIINNVLSGDILPKDARQWLVKDEDVKLYNTWEQVFGRKNGSKSFVFPANSFRLNKRLVVQQGDFLVQGDISKPFEDNLAEVLPGGKDSYKLFKYVIKFDIKERSETLLHLHRMNINRASLFPGLDGFAASLRTLLASPKNLLKP